jgi:hypothetical protein
MATTIHHDLEPPHAQLSLAQLFCFADARRTPHSRAVAFFARQAGRWRGPPTRPHSDLEHRAKTSCCRDHGGRSRVDRVDDLRAVDPLRPGSRPAPSFPVGTFFCVIHGPTAGRPWEASSVRRQLQRTAATAGVRRRFAPRQLRHAHAVEMAREGVPLVVIQRQLGHANLGITSIYLQGIDNSEVNTPSTLGARR